MNFTVCELCLNKAVALKKKLFSEAKKNQTKFDFRNIILNFKDNIYNFRFFHEYLDFLLNK